MVQLLSLEQKVVEAERPYNVDIKKDKPIYYDLPRLISDNDAYLLVAENNGEIVGTGYSQIQLSKQSLEHEKHAYLGFMYVSEKYRGKGLNKEIMNKLIAWAQNKGISNHYLEVYSGNNPAIRAYEKTGFKPCLIEMKLKIE